MNRPSKFDYRVGNTPALALLGCATWASAVSCCAPGQTTPMLAWLLPVTGLALTSKAAQARRRVVAYKAWSGRWNEMAGPPVTGEAEGAPRPRRRARWASSAGLLWCAVTYWLIAHDGEQGTPEYGLAAMSFMGLSVLGLGTGVFRSARWVVRRAAGSAPARGKHGHVVTVCPRVPLHSPHADRLTEALPDYCRAILATSDGPSAR